MKKKTTSKTEKSKTNPWQKAKEYPVIRTSPCGIYHEEIDRGVNFFVLMLEQLGAEPHYSCEGHPSGFYVLFMAPYELAQDIYSAGFFRVEVEGIDRWSIRTDFKDSRQKAMVLALAAESWEKTLGPLKTSSNSRRRIGRRVSPKH
jgi:hypothetical protein